MGAYSIPNDDRVSLLVFNLEEKRKIVAYYDDYSYTQNNEARRLTENEFYIIASTIKIIKK